MVRKIINIIYGTLLAGALFFAFALIFSKTPLPNGYKIFTVQSGSMEPHIKTGSLIFVSPALEYEEGAIITYFAEQAEGSRKIVNTVTHRVVRADEESQGYITQGDANDAEDPFPVQKERIIGKVKLAIPWLGYPVTFAKTLPGLILTVIVPASLIIFSETRVVIKEVKAIITKRREIVLG